MKLLKEKPQLLTIVAVALLLSNILLIFQNLKLRALIDSDKPTQTKEGDILEVFQSRDLYGNETEINYSNNKKRILFFFKTTCGFCEKQMKYWKALVSNADHQKYKITAVTTETDTQTVKSYIHRTEIENWEILNISIKQAQKANLSATPTTLVIGKEGVVERVWVGMWQKEDIEDVSKYFEMNLSTLSTEKYQ